MHRQIGTHLVVLALGMAMGLGAVAVAQNQVRPQAESSSDAAIVKRLKSIDRKLGANYQKTSLIGYTSEGFNDLYRATVESCIALNVNLGGSSMECPSLSH